MSPQIRLYQVDAFAVEVFSGNPAGVVPDADGLTDADMQAIAREVNNSETAFICAPTGQDHDVFVRFFTPTTEVPSCGHATLAAHAVRAFEHSMECGTVVQCSRAGLMPVRIDLSQFASIGHSRVRAVADVMSAPVSK